MANDGIIHWCLFTDLNTSYEPFLFFVGWTNNFEKIKHLLKINCKKLVLY